MSKNSGSSNKGTPMFAGILLGLLVGAALAAGLAWFVMKSPSPYLTKEPVAKHEAAKSAVAAAAAQTVPPAASGVMGADGKPRFEFYKVLTDKPDGGKATAEHAAPRKAGDKPADHEAKPATPHTAKAAPSDKHTYFLQAGAFAKPEEAEKLKAKLTLLGMEVNVQQATTQDGTRHRVRLGPYKGADEMNKIRATLKQNHVETFPIRVQ